ncbi:hypothetical protein OGATHE_004118 [Ogataea polymorpha]|uniref:Uncharacterized protein n=1 Tax=Ogataea polymorpha TaxID=460523 RepID=A0A9P8P4V8_9ASCO|nr:hypothetical protein OGATHE_004118 [Ogataea polymorpha]
MMAGAPLVYMPLMASYPENDVSASHGAMLPTDRYCVSYGTSSWFKISNVTLCESNLMASKVMLVRYR